LTATRFNPSSPPPAPPPIPRRASRDYPHFSSPVSSPSVFRPGRLFPPFVFCQFYFPSRPKDSSGPCEASPIGVRPPLSSWTTSVLPFTPRRPFWTSSPFSFLRLVMSGRSGEAPIWVCRTPRTDVSPLLTGYGLIPTWVFFFFFFFFCDSSCFYPFSSLEYLAPQGKLLNCIPDLEAVLILPSERTVIIRFLLPSSSLALILFVKRFPEVSAVAFGCLFVSLEPFP